ncbi:MAG: HD-GYP domain-containing protein [Candidatus Methylomirabilis sp.]|nr:HD-GYP domain-containing protein [Deltaproteobacteria bacterium]
MSETELSLERLLFNLNTLAELGEEITSPKDFTRVVKSSLYMVMGTFSSSKGAIFQHENGNGSYFPIASKGLGDIGGLRLKLGAEAVSELLKRREPVELGGGKDAGFLGTARETLEKIDAKVLACLTVKDELLGLIAINGKFSGEPFTLYDYQLLSVMSQHISFSLHSHSLLMKLMHKYTENKGLYENLRRIYYDTIHAFAAAIDAKDSYTRGHSHRVSAYSAALAREMGWSNEEVEGIRIAGLLHDIGKITVDKTIINKASPLTSYECRELNSHPVIGYEILSKIKFPWKGIPMMTRNHHEKVDGTGYPDRLRKSEIPIGARIMALVDAFDAMTTDRPYRPKLSFKEAICEVRDNWNRQFDPEVIHPFISVIRKEVRREADNPTIVPLLQEELDTVSLNRILEGFPGA